MNGKSRPKRTARATSAKTSPTSLTDAGDIGPEQLGLPFTGLEQAMSNIDQWWESGARRALDWLAETGEPFTAFDLTQLGVSDPSHPAYWGALFRKAQQDGVIEKVREDRSRRPTRASGKCWVWRGAFPTPTVTPFADMAEAGADDRG